jgi:hypothetical protein
MGVEMRGMSFLLVALVLLPFQVHAESAADYAYPISPSVGGRENTEWSTFYSYHTCDTNKTLPRVLLLGDSITQSIRGRIESILAGKAVVTYWVTSCGVVRPEYMAQLEIVLRTHDYAVIHFNNGLHMSNARYAEYAAALEKALRLVKRLQPKAKVLLATCTPLRDHPERCYVNHVNEIGIDLAKKLKLDGITDLYSLANGFDRKKAWRDEAHFTPESQKELASLAAECILKVLPCEQKTKKPEDRK